MVNEYQEILNSLSFLERRQLFEEAKKCARHGKRLRVKMRDTRLVNRTSFNSSLVQRQEQRHLTVAFDPIKFHKTEHEKAKVGRKEMIYHACFLHHFAHQLRYQSRNQKPK